MRWQFPRRPALALPMLVLGIAALLAGCEQEQKEVVPEVRPVRTITIERQAAGVPVVLTGRIEAEDEVRLGFRLSGRMIERSVNVGDKVTAGQLIARLEPQDQNNALRAAEANLRAAQAQAAEAENEFQRQRTLEERGFAARAVYERARQARETTRSQVEAAQAQLRFARDQVSFTELHADAEGVVTEVGAEPGEVVQAGQMIVRLARENGRDAVFDVPAQVIRSAPPDPVIDVVLTEDRSIKAEGRVREVGAQADPVTRTFQVKVGLSDPPPEMRLGATVTGRMEVDEGEVITVPASALTRQGQDPAVWVVNPQDDTVALRAIDVVRFEPASVVVSEGLEPGDIVVTAGVQALHPGQKVRLLEARS
ncbi:MAG: efflux RND transporter periplasmic adaptor subunit [Geminicoccaceae bacterium]